MQVLRPTRMLMAAGLVKTFFFCKKGDVDVAKAVAACTTARRVKWDNLYCMNQLTKGLGSEIVLVDPACKSLAGK